MALQGHAESLRMDLNKPRWPFYTAWILVTLFSIPVAFALDLLVMRILTRILGDFIYVNGVRHITEDYLGIYGFIPIVGLLMGSGQYALLRRHLPRMGGWVVATLGGWLLGLLLVVGAGRLPWIGEPLSATAVFPLMGLAIGLAQWVLLRRRLPGAAWWIAANLLGWGLISLLMPGNSVGAEGLFLIGLLPAGATAAALALFMNQTRQEPGEPG